MDIQTRKINFIQHFLSIQNEDSITQFENLLVSETIKFEPMSIQEFTHRIDCSMQDSKEDRVTQMDDLIVEISKWN